MTKMINNKRIILSIFIWILFRFFPKRFISIFISNYAGSYNPSYFNAKKGGGLVLHQVPDEYSELIMYLRKVKPITYLELGIGNGASFILNCFSMLPHLKTAVAVDNCSYGWIEDQEEKIERKVNYLKTLFKKSNFTFINSPTDSFFTNNTSTFDCIFIDADHSYESVKKDFNNAKKILNKTGSIILHDIASSGCPGVVQLWNEVKNTNCVEIIHSTTCGIGVYRKP